jgi:hypothetical protein
VHVPGPCEALSISVAGTLRVLATETSQSFESHVLRGLAGPGRVARSPCRTRFNICTVEAPSGLQERERTRPTGARPCRSASSHISRSASPSARAPASPMRLLDSSTARTDLDARRVAATELAAGSVRKLEARCSAVSDVLHARMTLPAQLRGKGPSRRSRVDAVKFGVARSATQIASTPVASTPMRQFAT